MIIKKSHKNEYCLSKSGHWVRDFTKPMSKAIDINEMMTEDIKLIVDNEFKNSLKSYQTVESEEFAHEKMVIIGDGPNFEENVKVLETLPNDVMIMGINGAFARWNSQRRLNYYVVNNPYLECMYFYPQIIRVWPKCIASIRTNPQFLEHYRGALFIYAPARTESYSGVERYVPSIFVDDYRNSACAAINLAHKFKVKKLLLMSTIETYEERPGAIEVKSGVWMYPQQKIAHDLIDANLYWLNKAKISTSYTDGDLDYEFASYIKSVERFFNDR